MAPDNPAAAGDVRVSADVQRALQASAPVVALESALITHGLPAPENLLVARQMEAAVVAQGSIPATVAVLQGDITIGLTDAELETLAGLRSSWKIGVRDFPAASLRGASGGTTVAATMFAARMAGIEVFATGGIGGVHRQYAYDVSADLEALASISMIVVSAGAKAILDLRATLERLETASVLVIGYGTTEFPAFYSRESGLKTAVRVDAPEEIAELWMRHCALGMKPSLLVANPIPETDAIPSAEAERLIAAAISEAAQDGISGQALTPFLLQRLGEMSDGRLRHANAALLVNNAELASRIASAVAERRSGRKAER
jgi:pseudouridine-5'-phosphate glycosidase